MAKDMNRIAVPHNFKVHLHGSLSLAGFVVVHKLRKEKMRGDGDISFLNNFSAVSLGLFRVRFDISPIRRADINEFVHVKKLLSIFFREEQNKRDNDPLTIPLDKLCGFGQFLGNDFIL
jgi:hypothetical protein